MNSKQVIKVLPNGCKQYFENNLLVKEEYPNGDEFYWFNKIPHRDNGPAQILSDGSKYWIKNGVLTRDDGPAIETPSQKEWYINGVLHRDNGPAIEMNDGTKKWFQNGLLHRENGPAVHYDNKKYFSYYNKGELHRIDGPAVFTYYSQEWWFLGKFYNEKEHKKMNLLVNKFIKKLKNKLKIKAKNILYDDVKVPKDLSNIISEYLY